MLQGNTPKAQLKILAVAINNGYVSKKALRLMSEADVTRSKALHYLIDNNYLTPCEIKYSYIDDGKKKYMKERAYRMNIYQYKKAKEHYRRLLEDVKVVPLRSNQITHTNSSNIRVLRRSEQMMMLQEIGYNVYPTDENAQHKFYTKEEILSDSQMEDPQQLKYIKSYGAVVTPEYAYLIYDLNRNSFVKIENWLEKIIFRELKKKIKRECEAKRIILGEKADKIVGIMQKNIVTFNEKGIQHHYMTDADLFKSSIFIPKTKDGETELEIVLMEKSRDTIAEYLGLEKLPTSATVDADGIKDDKYVLNFLIPDVVKLSRFMRGLEGKEHLGEIHCYEDVVAPLEELYPGMKITGHSAAEVYDYLLNENSFF